MGGIDEIGRQAVADALRDAERDRRPVAPVTEIWPGLDVDDAYAVQRANVQRRVAAGAVVRGHKVGLTARAMQEMLGVSQPDYGHLLDDMFVADGGATPAERYCAPRVEPEVAFVLDAPLDGRGCTVADVLRATAFVVPALEIIDSRIADWRIALADTIADNASSAGVVLGARTTAVDGLDLATLGVVLRRNGEIVETGAAGAVLGNPVLAVAWLANTLHGLGAVLDTGHVVLPGSCTRAVEVGPGDAVRADFDVLGGVSVEFS
jgi:2-keto-4-pentenoate hydratase